MQKMSETKTQPHPFQFTSTDGLSIVCARWDSRGPVRGIVQIAHGLGEHIGRYVDLAEYLVQAGLVVYGNDHRGHGRTALPAKSFGDFGPGGFNLLVEDMARLTVIAKTEHPEVPFILLGHSMGSFAAQQCKLDHSEFIDGLALSGSGALDGLVRLAQSDKHTPAEIVNAAFEPARTPGDCDPATVDAFLNDAVGRSGPSSSDPSRLANLRVLRKRGSRWPAAGRSVCPHRALSRSGPLQYLA